MIVMPHVLRITKCYVFPGLLALALFGCAVPQSVPVDSSVTQVTPDRVQAASDALEARLQLLILQGRNGPGG